MQDSLINDYIEYHPYFRPQPTNPYSSLISFRHGGSGDWQVLNARIKEFTNVRLRFSELFLICIIHMLGLFFKEF